MRRQCKYTYVCVFVFEIPMNLRQDYYTEMHLIDNWFCIIAMIPSVLLQPNRGLHLDSIQLKFVMQGMLLL